MSYEDFLKHKARRHQSAGVQLNESDIHESLHDWQKRIVLADCISRSWRCVR
jgi:adenosyl cobinamide kinase/adenosyl cobinamide phosphate guanylyltransferase